MGDELVQARQFRRMWIAALLLLCAIVVVALNLTTPLGNTAQQKFDVIIVLGTPARVNGRISAQMRARVLEAVHEYQAGVAPRIIVTGGAAHNSVVEAEVMGRLARAYGVPGEDVIEERRAMNTIQNAYYSVAIMQENGWHSAEIVSSPAHIRRASLIFRHFPVQWRMHASHWPPRFKTYKLVITVVTEAVYTAWLRVFGFPDSPFLHSGSAIQQAILDFHLEPFLA